MKRELEGGWFQWVSLPLPALLTIQSGINQLRYATLKGIMAREEEGDSQGARRPPVSVPLQRILRVHVPEKGEDDPDDYRISCRSGEDAGREAARRGEGALRTGAVSS